MPSTLEELNGAKRTLDRLEHRATKYREYLKAMWLDLPRDNSSMESVALTTGEVETVEGIITMLARRITGEDPSLELWEQAHPYCSRNEAKYPGAWAEQNVEYFKWFLIWIQKTRTYLDYLTGCVDAVGAERQSDVAGLQSRSDEPVQAYDVALSFAGEDREYAQRLAEQLRAANYRVFYDESEKSKLWGRNLYIHLADVYQNKARFCVMFISANYARKLWTKHEQEAAQARAFTEHREYLLPVRLDDTKVPGILDTTAYLDLRETSIDEVFLALQEKLAIQ
jgi:hypothetical protein